MMNTQVQMLALPTAEWQRPSIAALIHDALVSERRIRKDSNTEIERGRYRLCCHHIETWAAGFAADALPTQTLSGRYIDDLAGMATLMKRDPALSDLAAQARLAVSFVPPDQLRQHIAAFSQMAERAGLADSPDTRTRLAFLNSLAPGEFGIVELHRQFLVVAEESDIDDRHETKITGARPADQTPSDSPGSRAVPEASSGLSASIARVLAGSNSINLSSVAHPVVTEILHQVAYGTSGLSTDAVTVVYNDGSQAEPFAVGRLRLPEQEALASLLGLPPLRASLLSIRHLDMDTRVDMAWFLNQEASRPRPCAETDAFCCERTLAQLAALRRPTCIHLYQTGLQPAVVGFYRALLEWLADHRQETPSLVVVPQYYDDISKRYEHGAIWG